MTAAFLPILITGFPPVLYARQFLRNSVVGAKSNVVTSVSCVSSPSLHTLCEAHWQAQAELEGRFLKGEGMIRGMCECVCVCLFCMCTNSSQSRTSPGSSVLNLYIVDLSSRPLLPWSPPSCLPLSLPSAWQLSHTHKMRQISLPYRPKKGTPLM